MASSDPKLGSTTSSTTPPVPPDGLTPASPTERSLEDPRLFINREMALLEFQRRVLEEAQDESNPLLERVKFVAIIGSNLDEFFMVRVAGLKQQITAGFVDLPPDGLTPAEQLAAVRRASDQLMRQASLILKEDLLPRLRESGVQVLDYAELDPPQRADVHQYFDQAIFPVLTPLAFDPGRPFPHISNLSLNLAILIRDAQGQERFARLKVPEGFPRLVPLSSTGRLAPDAGAPRVQSFVWLEHLIAACLQELFPGMEIIAAYPFQVTRDADFVIQELEADDLLETVEQGVRERRFRSVVRLTVTEDMPVKLRDILVENLGMDPKDVYPLPAPLALRNVMELHGLDRRDLKDPPFLPAVPPSLPTEQGEGDLFAAIRQQDILLHHPFDSFGPVVDFIERAAQDPQVLAIKQTLYRVGRNSPVVEALLEAREHGKQVAVLVELKARFDEESNIGWARALEREGVHVIYGLVGLKTHAKVALVVRNEGDRIRRYVHLSTGNYNAQTAQTYTDLGFFTCDEEIGADATDLFNYLTGYSAKTDYRKLLVAPINLKARLSQLIEREIEHQREGRPGHLIFKMNSLADKKMIQLLYRASQAGVKVELLVRGICCLLPGVPGVSENIRVTSIVGRFLEHSRVFYFRNGGSEEVYLGSADLMQRNLQRRVEVLFPVQDPVLIGHLRDEVLAVQLRDNVKARMLTADGRYERVSAAAGEAPLNSQAWLLARRASARRG